MKVTESLKKPNVKPAEVQVMSPRGLPNSCKFKCEGKQQKERWNREERT